MGELGGVRRQAEERLALCRTGRDVPAAGVLAIESHGVLSRPLPASSLRIAVWADPAFATQLKKAAVAGDEAMKGEEKNICPGWYP